MPWFVVHTSQKSSEMRHIWASAATSAAWSSEVGPGESESTMGRPVALSMARRIMRISSIL